MGYFNYIFYCFLVPNLPSYTICLSGALHISCKQGQCWITPVEGAGAILLEEGTSLPGSAVIVSCSCSEILGHQNHVLCSSYAPSVRSLPLWAQRLRSDSWKSSYGPPGMNTGLQMQTPWGASRPEQWAPGRIPVSPVPSELAWESWSP